MTEDEWNMSEEAQDFFKVGTFLLVLNNVINKRPLKKSILSQGVKKLDLLKHEFKLGSNPDYKLSETPITKRKKLTKSLL